MKKKKKKSDFRVITERTNGAALHSLKFPFRNITNWQKKAMLIFANYSGDYKEFVGFGLVVKL